jgi:uncharacterized protein (UPF0276 family)
MSDFENIGYGLGLRKPHYDHILETRPKDVKWFEIISENFMDNHKGYFDFLADLRQDYRIITHGVSMNIGGVDELNKEYLLRLKNLADFLDTPWISDHICFTGYLHGNTHDLLPIPYTKAALKHISARIIQAQEILGRRLIFENPSSYVQFEGETMKEHEFISELIKQADCGILLDVNNVYVSSFNHGLDAKEYINAIPPEKIAQIHLAGHKNKGDIIIDTHDDHVIDEVWQLYEYTIYTTGFKPTMIEWDENIPEFGTMIAELNKAKSIAERIR